MDESQIIVSDTSSIEMHRNELYSSDLIKSLARTSKGSGIKAWVVLPKVSVPLSSGWKLLSPSQNLNQQGCDIVLSLLSILLIFLVDTVHTVFGLSTRTLLKNQDLEKKAVCIFVLKQNAL